MVEEIGPVEDIRVGQIDDLLEQIKIRVDLKERVLVTTLTKRMAEELADYLSEMGIRNNYLHSDIQTLDRIEILRDLRLGYYISLGNYCCQHVRSNENCSML